MILTAVGHFDILYLLAGVSHSISGTRKGKNESQIRKKSKQLEESHTDIEIINIQMIIFGKHNHLDNSR